MADTPDNKERALSLANAILSLAPSEGQTPGFLIGYAYARAEAAELARRAPAIGAVPELPPIEYDRDMQRTYIPLPGGWEVQTKGTGSTFRIANTQQRSRWPVLEERLHEVLEAMARDTRNALAAKEAEIVSLQVQLAVKSQGVPGTAGTVESAGAQPADQAIPDVLFDGHAVYLEASRKRPHRKNPTAENVADVLDAVVRLMRRPTQYGAQPQGERAMNDEFLKYALEVIDGLSADDIENGLREAGIEIRRTPAPADQPSLRADIDSPEFSELLAWVVRDVGEPQKSFHRKNLIAHINAHTTRTVEAAVAAAREYQHKVDSKIIERLRAELADGAAKGGDTIDVRYEFERWASQRGDAAVYIGDGLYQSGSITDQAEAFAAGVELGRLAATTASDKAQHKGKA